MAQLTPKEECFRLLNLLGHVVESLKTSGVKATDDIIWAEALANKAFLHAASVHWLSTGTSVPGLFGDENGGVLDYASTSVIARACLETYVTFHAIFLHPDTSVREFRLSAWRLAGMSRRAKYQPQFPEHEEQHQRDVEEAGRLKEAVVNNPIFNTLTKKQQRAVVERGEWHSGTHFNELARAAGLGTLLSSLAYDHASDYTHSGFISALQIKQAAADFSQQARFIDTDLLLICVAVSKLILGYGELFTPAQDTLTRFPEEYFIAQVNANAAFRSNIGSSDQEPTSLMSNETSKSAE